MSPFGGFQKHYSEEDPEKEQRVKEIELLLMSTEDELRGQPSLPVSLGYMCVGFTVILCAFDPGFEDSGWMCVCVRA